MLCGISLAINLWIFKGVQQHDKSDFDKNSYKKYQKRVWDI